MTKGILFFGFAVLVGSFVLFGENLNDGGAVLETASLSSSLEDANLYRQCFQEICGKPVEAFAYPESDGSRLMSSSLNDELKRFSSRYTQNEIELQILIKNKMQEILSKDLQGKTEFTLISFRDVASYYDLIFRSHKGEESFSSYLFGDFKKKSAQLFARQPGLKKWADQKFMFGELIELQKIINRSDLNWYFSKKYPDALDFFEGLEQISFDMTEFYEKEKWTLGSDIKSRNWSADLVLKTGRFYERHFIQDLRDYFHDLMLSKAMRQESTWAAHKDVLRRFSQNPEFLLVGDRALLEEAFVGVESLCRESVLDELYWASSERRNRSIEKHFDTLKHVAKSMFEFESADVKRKFDIKVNRLELLKSRSLQEAKAFYPVYFENLLRSQRKSIELLQSGTVKDQVLFLNAYFNSLPEFMLYGETATEVKRENFAYVRKTAVRNQGCRESDWFEDNGQESFFERDKNFLHLEKKVVRFFKYGVITMAHELGHGVSSVFSDSPEFTKSLKPSPWAKRACIDRYYLDEYREEGVSEAMQTEEDWADYFAVKLVKELKKKPEYSWAGERFECEFVEPYTINSNSTNALKPDYISIIDKLDPHSSDLFRIMAQEYYSRGKLGPVCGHLAKTETRLFETCE